MSASTNVIDAPYGSWESPITSQAITAGSVKLSSLHVIRSSNQLLWTEGRPQEGGRYVITKYAPESNEKSERNGIDVSPKDSNVRTRVHEYGGASLTINDGGSDGVYLYYSEFSTQRLMKLKMGENENAVALTPDGNRYRFADGEYCDGKIFMIREDHREDGEVINEIVSVDTTTGEMKVLATGRDFYSSPRVSIDGTQLAYVSWNHPNMPWDSTELRITPISEDASIKTDDHKLVSNSNNDTSVIQPQWHPSTGELYYLSDETGYYNIHKVGLDKPVLQMPYDFGGRAPGWILGQQAFSFLKNDGRLFATYGKDGKSVLLVADVGGDELKNISEYGMEDGLKMQFGEFVAAQDVDDTFYFLGGSPSSPGCIYSWSLKKKGAAKEMCASSSLKVPEAYISVPEAVEFPCNLGTAYGYYYKPVNANYKCTNEDPPLLVKAHGGPTACTTTSFNPGIQYWTSRGFAVLDVDYGGSTNYGRDYRRRLRGKWGVVDIDDVCDGAQYLVKEGLVDSKRMAIDGGSAGGYTTLGALAFRNVFTAGCSLYGVASLEALAQDTHKFESRYLDGLLGEYPKDIAIYKERAPIEHIDGFSCPILLLQGDEDKIVPPNQAELMHEALLKKGIPTALKMYKGEQHGFRKAENIEDALDSELYFYSRVFKFEAKGVKSFDIDNLKS